MKKWFISDTHFSHTNIISNQLNLCVEVWDYKAVAEKVLLSLLDKAVKNQMSSTEFKEDF